jgi:hypothetical protein
MSVGFNLKLPSPTFVSGPVFMLALDRAKKSLMHLQAIAMSTGSTYGDGP